MSNEQAVVVGGSLELIPIERLRRQLEVNVVGQVAVTQSFLPLLRRATARVGSAHRMVPESRLEQWWTVVSAQF